MESFNGWMLEGCLPVSYVNPPPLPPPPQLEIAACPQRRLWFLSFCLFLLMLIDLPNVLVFELGWKVFIILFMFSHFTACWCFFIISFSQKSFALSENTQTKNLYFLNSLKAHISLSFKKNAFKSTWIISAKPCEAEFFPASELYPSPADQLFLLLMTGKESSSHSVIFYWKELSPRRGGSPVFNGLIVLEKAASGNAVTGGNITRRRYWQPEKVKELA